MTSDPARRSLRDGPLMSVDIGDQVFHDEVFPVPRYRRIDIEASVERISRTRRHDYHLLDGAGVNEAVHRNADIQILVRTLHERAVICREPVKQIHHRITPMLFFRVTRRQVDSDGATIGIAKQIIVERWRRNPCLLYTSPSPRDGL